MRVNLPGFGPIHIAALIPVVLLALTIVGVVAFIVVDMALHPPTPEDRARWAEERAAEREAERAERAQAEAEERKELGYIDDPEVHKAAGLAIRSAGFSCPGVHGVRSIGDAGRGGVLRVQCNNNVFFALTIRPDGKTYTVKIME